MDQEVGDRFVMSARCLKESLKGFVFLAVVVGAVACGNARPLPSPPSPRPSGAVGPYDLALGLENQGQTCYANAALALLSKHPGTQACRERDGLALRAAFNRLMGPLQTHYALLSTPSRLTSSQQSYRQELRTLFEEFDLRRWMGHGAADAGDFLSHFLREAECTGDYVSLDEHQLVQVDRDGDEFEFQEPNRHVDPVDPNRYDPYALKLDIRNRVGAAFHSISGALPYHFQRNGDRLPILVSTVDQPHHLMIRLNRIVEDPAPPVPPAAQRPPIRLTHPVEISRRIRVPYYPVNYAGVPHGDPVNPAQAQALLANHQAHVQHVNMHPVAVICHSGNATSGHYYTYTRSDELNAWVKHDDQRVTPMTSEAQAHQAKDDMDRQGMIALYVR